jgi:hypothetical protein
MALDPGSTPSAESTKMLFFQETKSDYSPRIFYIVTLWINNRRPLLKDAGLHDYCTSHSFLLHLKLSAWEFNAWCDLQKMEFK